LNPRRKQLLFRSHHCGMKENDILLGHFTDRYILELTGQQLDDLDTLMHHNDIDVMNWIIGKTRVPEEFNTELMLLIQRFSKTA
jgi:antitoxin CptB